MEENMTKTKLLHLIQKERKLLEEVLEGIKPEDMLAPVLPGGWSIKDTLAHITTWEQNMIAWLGAAILGDEPQMVPPGFSSWDEIDAINHSYYERNLKKTIQEVLDAFHEVYKQAFEIIQDSPEVDLIDPDRFAWRKGVALWHIAAENTFLHYEEHRADIEAWLGVA